jgi:arsenate reductase-like glutaredoxin family protein
MFNRNIWTTREAKKWLKDHNYKHDIIEYTENYIRFRQIPSKSNKKYRTINFGKLGDIKAIIQII